MIELNMTNTIQLPENKSVLCTVPTELKTTCYSAYIFYFQQHKPKGSKVCEGVQNELFSGYLKEQEAG